MAESLSSATQEEQVTIYSPLLEKTLGISQLCHYVADLARNGKNGDERLTPCAICARALALQINDQGEKSIDITVPIGRRRDQDCSTLEVIIADMSEGSDN